MIFKRIRLENLFAYNGVQELDLTGCSEHKNIVLVSGRNGSGKTSFINSVKLLFLGSNDNTLRRVGFPPTTLSQGQYVRGVPGVWSGIINTQAQRQHGSEASISILWEEEDGSEIEARRSWRVNGLSYDEQLSFYKNGEATLPDDVFLQLAEKLPRDFVPFFFFDGEQIRELAEAEEAIAANEIERILNLSFVNEIEQGVSDFIRQRRRDALPEETQVKIRRAEGDVATRSAELAAAEKRLSELQEAIEDSETYKRQLVAERDELRTGVSETDRRLLEQRLETLQTQRSELARRISETLPAEAPFLANLALTLRVCSELDILVTARTAEELGKLDALRDELPGRLLDKPPHPDPPLHASQADHLRHKLRALLDGYIGTATPPEVPSYLHSLDLADAQSLRDRYLAWLREGERRRNAVTAELQHMRQLTAETERTEEELARASVASDAHLKRYTEIAAALQKLDNELADKYEQVGKINAEVTHYKQLISDALQHISDLEKEHEHAQFTSQMVQYARHVELVLREYKAQRREMRRESVENRINEKLAILLADHGQIKNIALSDRFIMTYYDNDAQKIGRASISAGMKQLVATALLWALKEESGKRIPLVIDTPLARIDRRNRVRLLESYYPNAGEQVIVLPTDSEIDDAQLVRLAPHIARRYRIENMDGENAKFVADDLSS